ncbi:MAG: hypothetical protein AB1489_39145 [Acidobacteriota bacterium]
MSRTHRRIEIYRAVRSFRHVKTRKVEARAAEELSQYRREYGRNRWFVRANPSSRAIRDPYEDIYPSALRQSDWFTKRCRVLFKETYGIQRWSRAGFSYEKFLLESINLWRQIYKHRKGRPRSSGLFNNRKAQPNFLSDLYVSFLEYLNYATDKLFSKNKLLMSNNTLVTFARNPYGTARMLRLFIPNY